MRSVIPNAKNGVIISGNVLIISSAFPLYNLNLLYGKVIKFINYLVN